MATKKTPKQHLDTLAKAHKKDIDTLEKYILDTEKKLKATEDALAKVKKHLACLKGYEPTLENFGKAYLK